MNRLSYIVLPLLILSGVSNALGQDPELEIRQLPIRNGGVNPVDIIVPREQKRAIGWFFKFGDASSKFCTGTVISSRAVVTAKHCFKVNPEDPTDERIYLTAPDDYFFAIPNEGSLDNGELIPAREFQLNRATLIHSERHDITIITFEEGDFNEPGLKPIQVNNQPIQGSLAINLMDSIVQGAGYGETYHLGEEGLRFASLQVELITHEFIMVNGYQQQGLCGGDSGGPLLAAGSDGNVTIFAVESRGDECCIGIDQLTRVDLEIERLISVGATTPNSGLYPEKCSGLSSRNRCQDGVLYSCEGDQVVREVCAESGLSCGYVREQGQFTCTSPANLGCANLPPEGLCLDDETLVRCELGNEVMMRCIDAYCDSFIEGGRKACIEYDSPTVDDCSEANITLLRDASKARLSTASQCGGERVTAPGALLYLWLLLALPWFRRLLLFGRPQSA